ncbi:hypothetical protein ACQWTT_001203 [Acinetobacter baumannii]
MSEDQLKIEGYTKSIEFGKEYPYDCNESGEMPTPLTPERIAAYGILADLLGRGGIKHELDNIDLDIREEIVETMAGIIKEAMK